MDEVANSVALSGGRCNSFDGVRDDGTDAAASEPIVLLGYTGVVAEVGCTPVVFARLCELAYEVARQFEFRDSQDVRTFVRC